MNRERSDRNFLPTEDGSDGALDKMSERKVCRLRVKTLRDV